MSGGGQGLRLSAQEDEPGRRCFGAMATYPAPTCTHPTIYLAWHGQWRRCSVCGAYLHLEGTLMARLRKLVTPRGRGREPRPHHRPVEVRGARPNWFPAGRIVDGSDMEVAEGGKPTDDFHPSSRAASSASSAVSMGGARRVKGRQTTAKSHSCYTQGTGTA